MEKKTSKLLDACAADDPQAIRRLGWGNVFDLLRVGWAKRFYPADFAVYVRMLAGKDPAKIEEVIVQIAPHAEYRPTPSALAGGLLIIDPPPISQGDPRRAVVRVDQTDRAYRAVLLAVACGQEVCDCIPRPTDVTVDVDGVLWCPGCDGIETGQYDQAVEWQEALGAQ
jgi:hypothetical protein